MKKLRNKYSKKIAMLAGVCAAASNSLSAASVDVLFDTPYELSNINYAYFDVFNSDQTVYASSGSISTDGAIELLSCNGNAVISKLAGANVYYNATYSVGDTIVANELSTFQQVNYGASSGMLYIGCTWNDTVDSKYAFLQLETDGTTTFSIIGYCYGDVSDTVIVHDLTSTVPEPATYAFAGGMAVLGVAALKRRKKNA